MKTNNKAKKDKTKRKTHTSGFTQTSSNMLANLGI